MRLSFLHYVEKEGILPIRPKAYVIRKRKDVLYDHHYYALYYHCICYFTAMHSYYFESLRLQTYGRSAYKKTRRKKVGALVSHLLFVLPLQCF
jgi:hypothetical protein